MGVGRAAAMTSHRQVKLNGLGDGLVVASARHAISFVNGVAETVALIGGCGIREGDLWERAASGEWALQFECLYVNGSDERYSKDCMELRQNQASEGENDVRLLQIVFQFPELESLTFQRGEFLFLLKIKENESAQA